MMQTPDCQNIGKDAASYQLDREPPPQKKNLPCFMWPAQNQANVQSTKQLQADSLTGSPLDFNDSYITV